MSRPFLFRLGRYKTLLISLTLSVVFGVLVCVSPYPSIFIVMRFCLAAASAGVYLTLYITREYFVQPLLAVDLQTLARGRVRAKWKMSACLSACWAACLNYQTVNLRMLNRCLKSFGVLLKKWKGCKVIPAMLKIQYPATPVIKQELNYRKQQKAFQLTYKR